MNWDDAAAAALPFLTDALVDDGNVCVAKS